jgi:hypothetical protein
MGSNRTIENLLMLAAQVILPAVASARLGQTSRTSTLFHFRYDHQSRSFGACLSDQFSQGLHSDLFTLNAEECLFRRIPCELQISVSAL